MLKAAKIRSYAPALNLVISELKGYPVGVKYHLKCYQSFTHKVHLERLSKISEQMHQQDKRNNDRLLAKLEETDTSYHLRQQQGALPVHQNIICQTYRATSF